VSLLGSNPEGSDYQGVAIYSTTDGIPLWGWRFEAGEIMNTLLFDAEHEYEVDPDVRIGMGIAPTGTTRGSGFKENDRIWIEDVVCTAESLNMDVVTFDSWSGNKYAVPQIVSNRNKSGGSSGGGGSTTTTKKYMVSVSASPANGGTVSGGGSYATNASATITATVNEGFEFVGWTGGGSSTTYNSTSRSFSVIVKQDLSFTALFQQDMEKIPCNDVVNGKANPLMDMALAPPSPNNIAGATYGMTRYGGTKEHKGIDLAGPVGTPIYAQFDGVIGGKVISTQPNKILVNDNYVYPPGYSGDKDAGGNRISVTSKINGQTVTNSYMHLRAGEPFGINPRTGSPWALNDRIYAGEIIGYIGVSGNAIGGIPHLHLKTMEGTSIVNPSKYLNATVTITSTTITTPCD
jgi:hypothetical protein